MSIGRIHIMHLGKFIVYKLSLHNPITIISPSGPSTIHSFRLNYTFESFDKNLLTESKCVCDLDIFDTNHSYFDSHQQLNYNGTHYDCFHNIMYEKAISLYLR